MKLLGILIAFVNSRCKKNRGKVSAIAYNLFRFDFFFFLKGERAGSWRSRYISIGGKNRTNTNFANIGNQVAFIDTITYFQQSLAVPASTMTDEERAAVKREGKKFILND